MQVGFVQFNPTFGDKTANVKRIMNLVARVNADLLVLPELFNTGYLFLSASELEELAEEIPAGATTRTLKRLAEEREVYLVAGIAERADGKFYNSAVLVSPSGDVNVYRKAHLFDEEKRWFTPGDTPFEVYDIGLAKIGIMVCFDWFFPEVTRILSLKGAEIICHPANLVLPYCQNAMITRCLENHVFAITCNRTGIEERDINSRLRFTGRSQIVSPEGGVLTQSGEIGEAVRVVTIEPSIAQNKSVTTHNDLFDDRRTDLFGDLLKSPIVLPATLSSGQMELERKSREIADA
ncbi:TPA: acyltransferase [Candidatus Poribacteria bacterium]|nr:acyltransferase [Candidatus Poribacteria bacterium]